LALLVGVSTGLFAAVVAFFACIAVCTLLVRLVGETAYVLIFLNFLACPAAFIGGFFFGCFLIIILFQPFFDKDEGGRGFPVSQRR
jgi:hypothetical protein